MSARSIVTVLFVCLALTGCSRSGGPVAAPPPTPPVDPRVVARSVHGDNLTNVVQKRGNPWALEITLASGEPTGAAPFAILAAMAQGQAGQVPYELDYVRINLANARRQYIYRWDPRNQTVTLVRRVLGIGAIQTFVGTASHVDTEALVAIGAGSRPVPEFAPPRQ